MNDWISEFSGDLDINILIVALASTPQWLKMSEPEPVLLSITKSLRFISFVSVFNYSIKKFTLRC
jgi:hypothetical protein